MFIIKCLMPMGEVFVHSENKAAIEDFARRTDLGTDLISEMSIKMVPIKDEDVA